LELGPAAAIGAVRRSALTPGVFNLMTDGLVINMMTPMSHAEPDEGAIESARARIADRFPLASAERDQSDLLALAAVVFAFRRAADGAQRPDITPDDVRDALRLLPGHRLEQSVYEFELLDHARRMLTWEEIGQLTGAGDRRLAHQQFTRLRSRLSSAGLLPEDSAHQA
jgi:hypothetical protein